MPGGAEAQLCLQGTHMAGRTALGEWRGRRYTSKQVAAYAVEEAVEEKDAWLVITVIVKFFG